MSVGYWKKNSSYDKLRLAQSLTHTCFGMFWMLLIHYVSQSFRCSVTEGGPITFVYCWYFCVLCLHFLVILAWTFWTISSLISYSELLMYRFQKCILIHFSQIIYSCIAFITSISPELSQFWPLDLTLTIYDLNLTHIWRKCKHL